MKLLPLLIATVLLYSPLVTSKGGGGKGSRPGAIKTIEWGAIDFILAGAIAMHAESSCRKDPEPCDDRRHLFIMFVVLVPIFCLATCLLTWVWKVMGKRR